MSVDAFEDSGWYQAGRIRERRERAELDAAVKELCQECDALLKGAVVHAPTLRQHVKRVRELMKKAGE